jgi:gliding motility-associated-like protein
MVNVVPLPEAVFTMTDVDICQSDPQVITNISLGAESYFWEISNDKGIVYSSSIEDSPQLAFNQAGVNTLTLFAFTKENQQGCIDSVSQTVNVLPKPALLPLTEVSREVECGVWTIAFDNQIDFPQNSSEGDILIDFGNGQALSGFEDSYIQQFIAPISGVHQVDITITGITSEGCTDTLIQTIDFEGCCVPTIYLPEEGNSFAFTPFNGGINELFQVKHEFVEQFEMEVYNREGQMVFRTDDKDDGWDGNYEGKKCDTGLYQVMIRYAGCQSGRLLPAEPINIQLFLMD